MIDGSPIWPIIPFLPLRANTTSSLCRRRLARGADNLIYYIVLGLSTRRSPPRGRTVLYNPEMQSLVVQTTIGPNSHSGMPLDMEESDRTICALCRRPLDPGTTVDEEDASMGTTSFMDSNYFRLLSEANQALTRRSTLGAPIRPPSAISTPTSSSRTSLDLDGASMSDQDPASSMSLNDAPPLSHDALNQGYYERFFVEQVKLGKGFRGSVFLCQHILDGVFLGEYAIKKVAIGDNHDWLVQMLREVHLLERLHHPNIISYKHAWLENHRLTKFGPEVACLFILMECANGGNLEEYIEALPEREMAGAVGGNGGVSTKGGSGGGSSSNMNNNNLKNSGGGNDTEPKKPLSARERILQERRKQAAAATTTATTTVGEAVASSPPNDSIGSKGPLPAQHFLSISEVWSFFFDICEGLAHLHRLGIIHRDLKPPNLLLSYSDNRVKGTKGERRPPPRVLISDFGECEVLDQAAKRDRTGATGTLEFLAPELLQVDEHGRFTNGFSFKGDMWSLGMILYYLCYSRLPYSQIDDVDLLKEEIRGLRSISLPSDGPEDRVVPEELKILIKMLLSTDKSKRPSCDEILQTLAPQRERMAREGSNDASRTTSSTTTTAAAATTNHINISVPSSVDRSSSATMTSLDSPTMDHPIPSLPHLAASSSPGVNTLVRRRSRSALRHQDASHGHRPLRQTQQNYPTGGAGGGGGANVSRLPGIRGPGKRVKPLGLGLRHMLRRRMLHYPYGEGFYLTGGTTHRQALASSSAAAATATRGRGGGGGQHPFSEGYHSPLQSRGRAKRTNNMMSTSTSTGTGTTTALARSTLGDSVVSAMSLEEGDEDMVDVSLQSSSVDESEAVQVPTSETEAEAAAARLGGGHSGTTMTEEEEDEEMEEPARNLYATTVESMHSLLQESPPGPIRVTEEDDDHRSSGDEIVLASQHGQPSPSSSYWSALANHQSPHGGRGRNDRITSGPRDGMMLSQTTTTTTSSSNSGNRSSKARGRSAKDNMNDGDEDGDNEDTGVASDGTSWQTDSAAAAATGVGDGGRRRSCAPPHTLGEPSSSLQRRRRRRSSLADAQTNRMTQGGGLRNRSMRRHKESRESGSDGAEGDDADVNEEGDKEGGKRKRKGSHAQRTSVRRSWAEPPIQRMEKQSGSSSAGGDGGTSRGSDDGDSGDDDRHHRYHHHKSSRRPNGSRIEMDNEDNDDDWHAFLRPGRHVLWQSPVSTVATFASLLTRIWFSQWLCYPITVRPIVLYPLLTLTMVWDRYLLAILAGNGGYHHHHHHHHEYHQYHPSPSEEPGHQSTNVKMISGKRRRRRQPQQQQQQQQQRATGGQHEASESSVTGDGYARDFEDDDDEQERVDSTQEEVEQEEEERGGTSPNGLLPMVAATTTMTIGSYEGGGGGDQALVRIQGQGHFDDHGVQVLSLVLPFRLSERQSLFWVAFAAGLAVQLLWVMCVWIASRGQVCAAP
ncbi:putative serine/threonine-protein kinase iks1 [Actinomortierella ambigua]|nr:putative serine/threonine-protein kinase iks1 [Actinomortierella ambigua]